MILSKDTLVNLIHGVAVPLEGGFETDVVPVDLAGFGVSFNILNIPVYVKNGALTLGRGYLYEGASVGAMTIEEVNIPDDFEVRVEGIPGSTRGVMSLSVVSRPGVDFCGLVVDIIYGVIRFG
jgi:hypothetical protein